MKKLKEAEGTASAIDDGLKKLSSSDPETIALETDLAQVRTQVTALKLQIESGKVIPQVLFFIFLFDKMF